MIHYNLLIVDDEKFVADGLAQYVDWEKAGFKAAAVYDAETALAVIKREKIDVLLTDIIMEDKTGLWLIEEAIKHNNDLKCVILSGHEEFSYAKTAIRLGVYDYLVKPVDFDELEKMFAQLYSQMSLKEHDNEADSSSNTTAESSRDKSEGLIINQAKSYIEKHYGEEIHLNTVAELVYVHPTYFSILFKKKTGRNFKEYLTGVRIEKAKEMLKDLSLRITDISVNVGYESPKHFSKVFKEVTGMTPKDWRNKF